MEPNPLAARIAISRSDFADALWCVVAAQRMVETTMDDGVALRALISTAIVSYSRPFIASYGTEPVKFLKISDLPALRHTPDDAVLHDYVIKVLRNKIVAHSDNEFRQVKRVEAKGPGGRKIFGHTQTLVTPMIMAVDRVGLGNLCGKALMACAGYIFEPSQLDSAAMLLAPRSALALPGHPGDVRHA